MPSLVLTLMLKERIRKMAKKPVRGQRMATSMKKSAFKPCAGCKTKAKCKAAGKCLGKNK